VEFVEKMIFQNFFHGKLQFFPTFFGLKFSAENSAEFSLEKNYEKSVPGLELVSLFHAAVDRPGARPGSGAGQSWEPRPWKKPTTGFEI
jgi:hypothetical protein